MWHSAMQLFSTIKLCYGKRQRENNLFYSLGCRIHMNVLSTEAEGRTAPVEMITLQLASQFLAKSDLM